MVVIPSLREMLKAGVHFGHKTSRWNPNMAKFIFMSKSGVHVINLEETVKQTELALDYLKQAAAEGKMIVLVGTKKQASSLIKKAGLESGAPYVNFRWIGGTLTNFDVIRKAIDGFIKDTETLENAEKLGLTKKEATKLRERVVRGEKNFGGLVNLTRKPELLILVGAHDEKNALLEARSADVPTLAIADTNTNPSLITYPIPANDDATKSLELFTGLFAKVIKENKKVQEKKEDIK